MKNAEAFLLEIAPSAPVGSRERFLARLAPPFSAAPRRISDRFGLVAASVMIGGVTLWLLLATPTEPSPHSTPPPSPPAAARGEGILAGRVISAVDGAGVGGALVRATTPSRDMTGLRGRTIWSDVLVHEAVAETDGSFALKLPVPEAGARFSVDVLSPGFRSLWETRQWNVHVKPGETTDLAFKLTPGLRVEGVVVDEAGLPIVDAEVTLYLRHPQQGYNWWPQGRTDDEGRFAVYDLELESHGSRGELEFKDKQHERRVIPDVYTLSPEQNRSHRIVLPSGQRVTGRVISAAGAPVPDALVAVDYGADSAERRATLSDEQGRFAFAGLPSGRAATLSAVSKALHESVRMAVTPGTGSDGLLVQLRAMPRPAASETVSLLGMMLATLTPELAQAYGVPWKDPHGVIILDAGANPARLGLGDLEEGDIFGWAGNEEVRTLRDFAVKLLAGADPSAGPGLKTVSCSFLRAATWGSQTDAITLSAADVDQLRRFLGK